MLALAAPRDRRLALFACGDRLDADQAIQLWSGHFDYVPGPDEDLRATLQRWADGFRNDPFTADASSVGVSAWSVDYEQAVQNIDLLTDRLANVLSELKSL